jgi:hypothetical protein
MQGLVNPDYPIGELGNLSLEVSGRLRALAVMNLIVNADSDSFYHNLIRSGMAREKYLRRLTEAGAFDDHHRCSGRYEAFLDAVAAKDFSLARRIMDLSPREWRKGHEYEDDYCYAQILGRLVQGNPPLDEIFPFLQQFEVYREGQSNARFDVSTALATRGQESFDEAFEKLLEEREAQIEADKKRGQLEEPEIVAQRQVFVEGLAILRLAEKLGLTTQGEYKYCPSLARVPMQEPFPGE